MGVNVASALLGEGLEFFAVANEVYLSHHEYPRITTISVDAPQIARREVVPCDDTRFSSGHSNIQGA